MTITSFAALGVSEALNAKLAEYDITEPSPVQASAIPAVLEGRDVLAQSQTGTGKTLAYLLPILQQIDPASKHVQALILAPTQELAMQIVRESERYGEDIGIRVQALIGGAAKTRQLDKLKLHPTLIVGTPGRIRELIEIRKLKLHMLRTLVVDEVDQVFQLGGAGDVDHILRSTLRDRQLLFLSATINDEIRNLASREMKEPHEVGIEPDQRTSKTLEHIFFVSEERDKLDMLRRIVRTYSAEQAIVFINNTDQIAEVEAKMNHVGLHAGALYGDADKTTRSHVLRQFREGKIRLLIASDVAARGLDIEKLGMVINFDPPIDADHYVHRVGRTGRMGHKGLAISIVTTKELFIVRKFSKQLDIDIQERALQGGRVTTPRPQSTNDRKFSPRESGQRDMRVSERTSRRPSPASSGVSDTDRKSTTPAAARKTDRLQDRKNKGAPKWLKNKPPRT